MKALSTTMFHLLLCIKFATGQLFVAVQSPAQASGIVQNTLTNTSTFFGPLANVVYRGGPQGLAFFSGSSNLGIPSGIFLSTGSTVTVTNAAFSQTDVDHTVEGDTDLQTLTINPIDDVAVLEFDFIPKGDSLHLKFVFASEEYPEYVCNIFTDVMGVFLTGPNPNGGNYVNENIALIPSSTFPIGINTINQGTPGVSSGGGNCSAPNQSLNYSGYFVNNNGGTTVIFDGFTVPINISAPLYACENYHIKIAVGDVVDGTFDSGLFLESNSFTTNGNFFHIIGNSGISSSVQDTTFLCTGDTVNLSSPINALSYNWGAAGTSASITVNSPGTYQCVSTNPNNGCFILSYTYRVIADTTCAVDIDESSWNRITVSPNPFNDRINITNLSGETADYFLSDVNGRILTQGILNTKDDLFEIPIEAAIPEGIYILNIVQGERKYLYKMIHHKL
jgi:Secretion system C-terminal sorting domain